MAGRGPETSYSGTVSLQTFLPWEQGWRSGESARLPPMCPGFDSWTRRRMWAEFVGSLLCSERFFSGYSGFPLSAKTNISFDLIRCENCKDL